MNEPSATHDQGLSGQLVGARPPTPLDSLREAVLDAAQELANGQAERQGRPDAPGAAPDRAPGRGSITLERPRRAEFGDYSTNAALVLAPVLGASPREVAVRLGDALQERLGVSLDRFEVAGPGFLNLFLSDSWLVGALGDALGAGELFGADGAAASENILVEFVSANPTGPMHVGHARNAAYGDALSRVLAFHGHRIGREFYVNDAGSQVRKLGESIHALANGEPVPEDGYQGAYVEQLASLLGSDSSDPVELGRAAVSVMVGEMKSSLAAFGVTGFDSWAYESSLHEGDPSPVQHTLSLLEEQGRTYRRDAALWLRTTEFGDDKDRVLVRSNGEHTYFASDIAYHQDKRERGFERQIDVWGADHHGYVQRLKAAYEALGGDREHLELLIMQLVHLVRGGERAQMSKRAGEFVTLDELLAEIGVDAARWYLLARSHDTTVDLDLDLAREQSNENPVYYVQYAHARIASILAKAGPPRVSGALAAVAASRPGPLHVAERTLIELLLAFPVEVAEAAERRAPHRIAAYALELAQGFTAFYRDCRVVGAEPESVESLRIGLCVASQRLIARSLGLLGVDAPDAM
ncbi:MAG: arginine--tRNA ligase [Actinobacteria bacterium]|nr:MAG: arginine--tRNA ligase [Actinomycetota bacterium]